MSQQEALDNNVSENTRLQANQNCPTEARTRLKTWIKDGRNNGRNNGWEDQDSMATGGGAMCC